MKIVFVPVWGFLYKQLTAPKYRRIDVRPADDALVTGTVIVYMEFDFPQNIGKPKGLPGFSGKYAIRKIQQTLVGYPGVAEDKVVLMVKRYRGSWFRIKKGVQQTMAKHEKEGGIIPPP